MPNWILAKAGAGPRRPSDDSPPDISGQKKQIETQALAEGFAKMRVTTPDAVPEIAGRLRDFLAAGRHGQMGWMAERTQ